MVKFVNLIRVNVKSILEASQVSYFHLLARLAESIITRAILCLQEREVKIGEEERTRMRPRRESWCSRKMDKVRVRQGDVDNATFSRERVSVTHSVFILHRVRPSDKNVGQW